MSEYESANTQLMSSWKLQKVYFEIADIVEVEVVGKKSRLLKRIEAFFEGCRVVRKGEGLPPSQRVSIRVVSNLDEEGVSTTHGSHQSEGHWFFVQDSRGHWMMVLPGKRIIVEAKIATDFCLRYLRSHILIKILGSRALPLHASAVALSGRAFLIIGKGGVGKTRLTLKGIDRGGVFISDDWTLISQGNVRPFLKTIHLCYYDVDHIVDKMRVRKIDRLRLKMYEKLGATIGLKIFVRLGLVIGEKTYQSPAVFGDTVTETQIGGVVELCRSSTDSGGLDQISNSQVANNAWNTFCAENRHYLRHMPPQQIPPTEEQTLISLPVLEKIFLQEFVKICPEKFLYRYLIPKANMVTKWDEIFDLITSRVLARKSETFAK
jgi:hypothetical protein